MSGVIPPAQPPPDPPHHGLVHPLSLWRWRHNPLYRCTDRLQGRIALALLLLVPILGLGAAFAIGDAAHRHYRAAAEHQRQTLHRATAVLTHDAPDHPEPGSAEARENRYPATVRFTDPHGRTRTAETGVLPGLSAGSSVHVWVDADGAIAEPPMTTEQIRSRTMGWGLVAFLTVTLAGAAAYRCATVVLRRRNLAEWDTEWAETAPRWTTSP
ncbi:Rv1733c family protein [Streptomyces iranensis]|uniref:Proline rich protein membrane protein n=1 Tax=Streptomyces iranensis TaxID=576784 RepID=A0A060ZJC8_9ACTN|nr:hypothetical protein [Streptomyces iranensis]MBP2063225.1 hypothetical protein [Streptomyces iranensis]CDR02028.1 predicted protein [Streptomyces iranensis]